MSNDQGNKLTAKTAPRTLRAVLYARVSTDEQAEKGYSLPSQLEASRKYAEAHGFVVIAEITDDYTGTKLDRPGLDKVRAMIANHEVDAVIVYTTDRWTRKLAHMLILREEFERAGIELHFVNKGKSEDTPESRMMENIEGVFNEYWREKIIEGSRRGTISKVKAGKVVGGGIPPYGYQHVDGQLVIIDDEASIIRQIFTWYIIGNEDDHTPMSGFAIAEKLSKEGIPTPGAKYGRARKRGSTLWYDETVLKILADEIYTGIYRWGKRVGYNGNGGKRPVEEQITVTVPAIVSHELWEAAQAQRKHNKKMSPRNATPHRYLLRGMVYCGCGRSMTGQARKGYHYYRCSSYVHRFGSLEERRCTEKHVRGDVLDRIVWEYVLEMMTSDEESFKQRLLEAQTVEREALQPKQDRLVMIEGLITKCEAEAARQVQALISTPGGIVGELLRKQIEDTNSQHTALLQERDALRIELEARALTDGQIATALEFREAVMQGMHNPTFEDKRMTLEALQMHVVVHNAQAHIKCRIPLSEKIFDLSIAGN